MKKINKLKGLALIASISFGLSTQAQTNYNVTAQGMAFSPNSLTIQVGDSVTFTNVGGTHNVNGTTATFPSNPASFGSGSAAAAPWVYGFRFTVAGHYDYRCDIHFSSGMTGTIDVQDTGTTTGIVRNSLNNVGIFPNPANNSITIQNSKSVKSIIIYDELGNKVITVKDFNQKSIDISGLQSGVYFIKMLDKNGISTTHKIIRK